MPPALKPAEKIKRAESLIAECRAMPEPPRGNERGHWVVKVRSRLGRAARLVKRKRYLAQDPFNASERQRADELLSEIDRLYPNVRS